MITKSKSIKFFLTKQSGCPQIWGNFPRFGEMKNFNFGEFPQIWGDGIFLIVILVDLKSSNKAIITQSQYWTIVDSIYKKKF